MRSLRGQFILSHILPFVLILPLAGLVLLYLVEAQVMLGQLSADLEERAALIAEAVARQPEILADGDQAQRFIADVSRLTDGDIYLLDDNGALVAADPDLDAAPDLALVNEVENSSAVRVNVSYTPAGQEGEAVAPIIDVNEQLVGLVGVRESLGGLASSFGPLRRLVLLTVLGGMALGLLLAGFALVMGLSGWDITRTWLWLLGAALAILVGLQLGISWVLMRVLEELSVREARIAADLDGEAAERPGAGAIGALSLESVERRAT